MSEKTKNYLSNLPTQLPLPDEEPLEALHKGRAVEPDLDLHLAGDAVGVHDPAGLDIGFLFHSVTPSPPRRHPRGSAPSPGSPASPARRTG